MNRTRLRSLGVNVIHGDIRSASDFEDLPPADWVIDAAANPSVLAGVSGNGSSRQLFEHNLASLVNVVEYCKASKAGLLLLSSSRVYSISELASLPLKTCGDAFRLDASAALPEGVSEHGIDTEFSTAPPISLYGSTKLACEIMALEYGAAYDFPVWVNRCGVLAGAGQFGTPDQGIVSYWINAHLRRRPLKYIGFNGQGRQVRDFLHPRDLASLLDAQLNTPRKGGCRLYTAGGGAGRAVSLAELNRWCDARFGAHCAQSDNRERPYDIPWMIMDNAGANRDFGWKPLLSREQVLEEIAAHAEQHPDWLERSGL
ncbi:MAG: NAD-dependent epimerase/dehydratase family protein [Bryobacterales bacterium]|nr:NAD-dependent epimerase/dehydratase family protein [Bryobacterales bacterium]